jgi:hypothetical protein
MISKIQFSTRFYKGNRIAQVMQFNEILDLCAYSAEDSPGLGRLYDFAKKNKLSQDYLFAVARHKGEPIAVACVHNEPSGPYIQAFVRKDYRKKRVGACLVNKLSIKRGLDFDSEILCFGSSNMPKLLRVIGFYRIVEHRL